MSLSDRLFCNHHAHPLRRAWCYCLRCAMEVSVWFKSRLKPWYISIPSNHNQYSTKIIMKITMANNCKQCFNTHYQPHCHPLQKAHDSVAVSIAGRRTNLVVYGWRPNPPTKNNHKMQKNVLEYCTQSDMNCWLKDLSNNGSMQKEMPWLPKLLGQ